MKARNPQARQEHLDLLTGQKVRPGSPGSMATGRYTMRMRPGPGEPFQDIEVDREDMDAAKDTYGVAKETFPKYRKAAGSKAKALAAELKRIPVFERDAQARIPGARTTFSSPPAAVKDFLSHNPSLWNLGWADVADQVEDWMDTTEAHTRGGRHKALDETARGREILDMFHAGRNDQGFGALLAYLFGQARGRRWDEVDWDKVDDLVEIFAESARREADRQGTTDFLPAGVPRIEWLPPATGFAEATPAFMGSLDPRGKDYYRRWRASKDLYQMATALENALKRGSKCLTADERKTVRARIKTIRGWAQRPDTMPEWACASFREPAELCDLLGIEAELNKLSEACESGYDASWAVKERDGGMWQPGLGVLPEAARHAPAVLEDLDLPWERSANHARLRERLKRR